MVAGVYGAYKRKKDCVKRQDSAKSNRYTPTHMGYDEVQCDQYIQMSRTMEEAPDQDMQVSGGQFQGKLQSAIQKSLIL